MYLTTGGTLTLNPRNSSHGEDSRQRRLAGLLCHSGSTDPGSGVKFDPEPAVGEESLLCRHAGGLPAPVMAGMLKISVPGWPMSRAG